MTEHPQLTIDGRETRPASALPPGQHEAPPLFGAPQTIRGQIAIPSTQPTGAPQMTVAKTLTLSDPRDLPGHERGRQALVTALHGEHCAVKVTGRWEHDTFIATRIEDVYDDDEGCWASEYGSPLYPMAIEAT